MIFTKSFKKLKETWASESDKGPAEFVRSHMDKFSGRPKLLSQMVEYLYDEVLSFDITDMSPDDYAHFRIEEMEAATLPRFLHACADHYELQAKPEQSNTLIWKLPDDGPCGEMLHLYKDTYVPLQERELGLEDEFMAVFEAAAQIVDETYNGNNFEMLRDDDADPIFTPKPGDSIIDTRKLMNDSFDAIDEIIKKHDQELDVIKTQMRALEKQINAEILSTKLFRFSKKPMGSSLLNTDYRGFANNTLTSNAIPHADRAPVALAYWGGSSTIMLDNSQFEHIPKLKLYLPKTSAPIQGRSLPREHFALIAQGALHKAPSTGLSRWIRPSNSDERFVSIAGLKPKCNPTPNSAL